MVKNIIEKMACAREICRLGLAERKRLEIKVRQPLFMVTIMNCPVILDRDFFALIENELNVGTIVMGSDGGVLTVTFDTRLTEDLRQRGEAREIIRRIQQERKKNNVPLDEYVDADVESLPDKYVTYIKRKALVKTFRKGVFRIYAIS